MILTITTTIARILTTLAAMHTAYTTTLITVNMITQRMLLITHHPITLIVPIKTTIITMNMTLPIATIAKPIVLIHTTILFKTMCLTK